MANGATPGQPATPEEQDNSVNVSFIPI